MLGAKCVLPSGFAVFAPASRPRGRPPVNTYSLSHLTDPALLRDLASLVARDRATTALLLAHIAEVNARQLYLPAGFPSMFSYCVGKLRMSRQGAYKRIRVARAALQFPAIFVAIEEGRLHLSGMVILAPHLTPENVDELLAAANHKTELEIERLLAERFPRPDVPTKVVVISQPTTAEQIPQMALSSRRVET